MWWKESAKTVAETCGAGFPEYAGRKQKESSCDYENCESEKELSDLQGSYFPVISMI
jgi:hypothetical protein